MRILLVEDDDDIAGLAGEAFRRRGDNVDALRSAEPASTDYDLAIVDIGLPGMLTDDAYDQAIAGVAEGLAMTLEGDKDNDLRLHFTFMMKMLQGVDRANQLSPRGSTLAVSYHPGTTVRVRTRLSCDAFQNDRHSKGSLP